MVAYWIAALSADEMEPLKDYAKQAQIAVKKYGGRPLSRAGRFELLEGKFIGNKVAVIEFDSMDEAINCYNSEEYQKAKSLREGITEGLFFVVDGTI
ncbi:MAG: hypothetical protein CFH41_02844 [Alphaproteobacteria bacterium MarineAlpha11_Bin1]|nr:MAG: hypothetical protein CFH41_02844 [Alphaproteobacteria bacterium MarineAlpha11_Bin1]|tara:strand:+ start:12297 stop:12587 length:291 start_codon:yes stop_codon:yes gene_type:complete